MAGGKERQAMEEYYRELFTRQVMEELTNQLQPLYAEELGVQTWRQKWEEEQTLKRKKELEELRQKHPINTSPRTIYHELYGTGKLHPFRKRTAFTKPIDERLDNF